MRSARIIRTIGSAIVEMNFEIDVRVGVWICCISVEVAVSIVMVVNS